MNGDACGSVLVVDDNGFVLESTALLLKDRGFMVFPCKSAFEAMEVMHGKRVDAVLTDIKMPGASGIKLLEQIHRIDRELPVILMTAHAELDVAVDAIKRGAFDFIIKPYKPEHLYHSIKKAVKYSRLFEMERNYKRKLEEDVAKRTQQLSLALKAVKDMNVEIVHRLTAVSEFRDSDTGAHIKRIGIFSAKLAEGLGLDPDFVDQIRIASSMHDLGKIGIPDSILLKPGPLTPEEFEVMKTHTTIGERMLADSPNPAIKMAAKIALTHHERCDGTGYPSGLKGDEIPTEGRIVILADQYDALRSKRPYKEQLSHEESCRIILEGDKRTMPGHFDPDVLKAFQEVAPFFDEIFDSFKD